MPLMWAVHLKSANRWLCGAPNAGFFVAGLMCIFAATEGIAQSSQNPEIEMRKSVGTVVDNRDGTFSVPFTLRVTNVGPETLERVQLIDSLNIFGDGAVVGIVSDLRIGQR